MPQDHPRVGCRLRHGRPRRAGAAHPRWAGSGLRPRRGPGPRFPAPAPGPAADLGPAPRTQHRGRARARLLDDHRQRLRRTARSSAGCAAAPAELAPATRRVLGAVPARGAGPAVIAVGANLDVDTVVSALGLLAAGSFRGTFAPRLAPPADSGSRGDDPLDPPLTRGGTCRRTGHSPGHKARDRHRPGGATPLDPPLPAAVPRRRTGRSPGHKARDRHRPGESGKPPPGPPLPAAVLRRRTGRSPGHKARDRHRPGGRPPWRRPLPAAVLRRRTGRSPGPSARDWLDRTDRLAVAPRPRPRTPATRRRS